MPHGHRPKLFSIPFVISRRNDLLIVGSALCNYSASSLHSSDFLALCWFTRIFANKRQE